MITLQNDPKRVQRTNLNSVEPEVAQLPASDSLCHTHVPYYSSPWYSPSQQVGITARRVVLVLDDNAARAASLPLDLCPGNIGCRQTCTH
jgi:hypothetical protein